MDKSQCTNVYTQQTDYHAWLSKYTEKINQMDEFERRLENRQDYREESQIYPDYLDYVEEWEWLADEQLIELKSKIIQAYSKRHQKLKCKCGMEHILTTFDCADKGDVVTNDPSRIIYNTCWYVTISEELANIKSVLKHQDLRFADPVHNMLHDIIQWRLVDNNTTPILLPYETFKAIWWSPKDVALLSKDLLKTMKFSNVSQLVHKREDQTPKIKDEGKRVLLNFPESDHGFHQLMSALQHQEKAVFNWMNKQRASIGKSTDMISYDVYQAKKRTCKACKLGKYSGLSVSGIYYAPPGGGKTTTLNRGLLVAFDTDWIGVGITWREYGFLLRRGIPILTNQPEIFIGCGLKIIGILPHDIRKVSGVPLDTYKHLRHWANQHSRNVLFIDVKRGEYLAHYVLRLQSIQLIQQMIANYSINQKPFYENETTIDWLKAFPKLLRNREKQVIDGKEHQLLHSSSQQLQIL